MGTDATKDKNAFAAKAHDRLNIFVKKGLRGVIRERARACGKSLNAYVVGLVMDELDNVEKR